MSTSGPNAPADDDDDAATVDADERNDNEAARDAAATALWTRCLEHAGTSPRDPKIPTHVAVLKDIHGADYSTLLKCPLDDRTEHPYGQKGERKLAATGALARCRIEFFASDYTGLFRQGTRTGLIRFSTAVAPPTGAASLVLGKAKHSKLFPLVAIKCMRANGPSGNLLFAGAKTGQAERDFFAHGLCTQLTRKVPTAAQPALRAFEKYSKYPLALGLSEFATLDEDGCDLSGGCEELGATFPWALHLHPRVATPPLPDGAPNTAFVDALLATVAPETVLYDVYAAASPDAVSGKDVRVERIGRVVATSVAIPSPAGSPIVFRHQAKEDDYALRPQWADDLKKRVVAHDGAAGTAGKNVGSKFFDGLINAGRVVDHDGARPAPLRRQPFENPLEGL
jgi:hypothetical protein